MKKKDNQIKLNRIDSTKIILAVLSGLLLTGSFPSHGIAWISWIALVPLLISLRGLSFQNSFRIGLLAGIIHNLTLVYWLAYTMNTYGNLPLFISIPVLFLISFYLALYTAIFSTALAGFCKKPLTCIIMAPVLWVSLEYLRSFLFTGLPWELIGYSQFNNLHLIQISDIFGVYGVSFIIILLNVAFFMAYLCLSGRNWQGIIITKGIAGGSILVSAILVGAVLLYGKWSLYSVDEMISASPSVEIAVIQGNIDQSMKWDPKFQVATVNKYVTLSLAAGAKKPDLVVWPESATPFYYRYNPLLTRVVQKGIIETGSDFLIGSPSFILTEKGVDYYNSAYLIKADGTIEGKYNKAHLVPFGEYVPYRKWLPFLGKMVEHVGDFRAGEEGKTIKWGDDNLGVQICYEIIFPNLSRKMVKNNATFIINITNDAWYGRTSAPYQHFSMSIFRAVENKRSLIRSANTGISGFIDPAGRIVASTDIFKKEVLTASMPRLHKKTVYTRFGDIFAMTCLAATLFLVLHGLHTKRKKIRR